MPTARRFLSTSAVNGKIYAIGGGTSWDVVLKEGVAEEYDTGFAVSPQGNQATTWGEIKQYKTKDIHGTLTGSGSP